MEIVNCYNSVKVVPTEPILVALDVYAFGVREFDDGNRTVSVAIKDPHMAAFLKQKDLEMRAMLPEDGVERRNCPLVIEQPHRDPFMRVRLDKTTFANLAGDAIDSMPAGHWHCEVSVQYVFRSATLITTIARLVRAKMG